MYDDWDKDPDEVDIILGMVWALIKFFLPGILLIIGLIVGLFIMVCIYG